MLTANVGSHDRSSNPLPFFSRHHAQCTLPHIIAIGEIVRCIDSLSIQQSNIESEMRHAESDGNIEVESSLPLFAYSHRIVAQRQ